MDLRPLFTWERFILAYATLLIILLGAGTPPGMYVGDEIIYLLMADSVSRGSFEIYNGLGEYDSPELILPSAIVRGGRLYSITPPLYALIAQPFYLILGPRGLSLINTLGFAGSVVLTYLISDALLNDRRFSAYAAVFYSLLPYGLEYSMDVWPHMLSVFLVMLAVYLTLTGRLFCAGLSAGLSVGVRYPNILLAAVLVAYAIRRHGLMKSLSYAAAASLPVAATLLLYHGYTPETQSTGYGIIPAAAEFKFNTLNTVLPTLALTASVAYLLAKRSAAQPLKASVLAVLLSSLALYALDGSFPDKLGDSLRIAYAEVFDMQYHPAPGVLAVKKGLLQASPILALCLFAPALLKGRLSRDDLALLYAPACAFILFYSSFHYMHGGLTPHMRYFLETAPYLSILAAYSAYRLWTLKPTLNLALYLTISAIPLTFFLLASHVNDALAGVFVRAAPAFILIGLASSAAYHMRRPGAGKTLSAFILMAAVYSLSTNVSDTAKMMIARSDTAAVTGELGFIAHDAVLMLPDYTDVTVTGELKLGRRLRIADTSRDRLATAAGLLAHYRQAGVPVYLLDEGNPAFKRFIESNVTPYPHRLVSGNRTRVYVVD